MVTAYVLLLVWMAIYLFASYHAVVNGYTWAIWLTGISLFALFALILAWIMFRY